MFSWKFAKSAEALFSQWAVKKFCKFVLKKKLGQLILGDIDLDQLDVQLSAGTFQLSDLALNVDYLNQKFGDAAILSMKEGSIGSLEVKLPWKGREGCQIEVNELELVLGPRGAKNSKVGSETYTSGQDSNSSGRDLGKVDHEMVDISEATAMVDVHEGVKTVAKMVKWLLTSFHVKINRVIIAFDPSLGEERNKGQCRTLVLRFSEVECGTGISEDINPSSQDTVAKFLGLSRLTNFVKFHGAILEFLQINNDDCQSPYSCAPSTTSGGWYLGCCHSNATTPIIIGKRGGFSGTINLSIPWKNGSLDIRKVDADVNIDPLELRFQPKSIKCFLYLLDMFKSMGKNSEDNLPNNTMGSIYYSAASQSSSSTLGSHEFATDKMSHNHESFSADSYSLLGKETITDALLRGSHLISDWVTSPNCRNSKERIEEPDFGASVDQFFECFDELRNSQSALASSGVWNWTCSVFSAITAASNLASGTLHIPSEQKHVETNLKARIVGIRILLSFVDGDEKHSHDSSGGQKNSSHYVHYMGAEFQDLQLALQVRPREMNFEATVKHIEVADHFSNGHGGADVGLGSRDVNVETQVACIRNMQASVQGSFAPLFAVTVDANFRTSGEYAVADVSPQFLSTSRCTCTINCGCIYRDDVVKVVLLQTSAITQGQFTVATVSSDDMFSGPVSFSLKLPPLVFWVNFHVISTVLDLIQDIGNSCEIYSTSAAFPGKCRPSSKGVVAQSCFSHVVKSSPALKGNISLLNARVILCFPCEKGDDFKSYSSSNQFIALDFSSPYSLGEKEVRASKPFDIASCKERYSVTCSLHLDVGNLDIYVISPASQDNDSCGKLPKFFAQRVLSVADKAGHPSVFDMYWQEGCVSGPWIAKRAKALATSDGMTCRNKFMGKGYEFASVSTIKDMEDFNSRTRQELLLSSAFLLHAQLSPIRVNLDRSLYKDIRDLLNQVSDWLTCLTSDPVRANEKSPVSQTSVLLECDSVEFSISINAVEGLKGSIQNELPGSWHRLKLKIQKFELLSVSNIGEIGDASFLWVSHGEGNLWGSITGVSDQEFLLVACNNSTRGRGNGEGSNILSSRFSGSDIVHFSDPENAESHLSINVRCGTIVAKGGRLDWVDTLVSFFSLPSPETNHVGDNVVQKDALRKGTAGGSSFVLNLIDVGVSYEPYFYNVMVREGSFSESSSANANGNMTEQYVAGFLAASSLKLSNVMVADLVERDYNINVQDLGLLICAVSELKIVGDCYSAQHLRKNGYAKVAQEAHVEALFKTNCKNGHLWEVECSESHIVLDTCQDTASGLIRLADQLQQLFAPDIEESVVHLQTRWDNVQQAQVTDEGAISSGHFSAATSQVHSAGASTNKERGMVNLMDEVYEGAFCLDGIGDSQSESEHSSLPSDILGEAWTFSSEDLDGVPRELSFTGAIPVIGLDSSQTSSSETSIPEIIEGYFLSDLRPLSELSLNSQSLNESLKSKFKVAKDGEARKGNTGWYGDTSLRILENHVGEKTSWKQPVESVSPSRKAGADEYGKLKGRVLVKNINVKWRLYAGSDWLCVQKNVQHASSNGRDTTVCLELALSEMGVQYYAFPDGEVFVSRLSFSIQDFRLNDNSKDAPWKMVLGYYESKDHPRESTSKALKLDLEAVRPHPATPLEEYRLRIALLPMILHLHQSQLDFLVSFFGETASSSDHSPRSQDLGEAGTSQKKKINHGSRSIAEEALLPYFQKFDIWPVLLRVDYSPSHVDLAALRGGKYVELVNLVPWKGVELQLKHVQAVGVYGWSCVCETIVGEWLEDISQNQIRKLLKGLPPIRSLVAVGAGATKLVSLPLKSYKKDQRILKGMQRGTIAFLRSISVEAIGLGVHLAAGAHNILLQAEYILTNTPASVPRPLQNRVNTNVRSNQPKDARQGIQQAIESISDGLGKSASALVQTPLKRYQRGVSVGSAFATAVQAAPAAAIAPASAAARAMHFALLGVRNSLDPEHKKESMDKYLGTTQPQPR